MWTWLPQRPLRSVCSGAQGFAGKKGLSCYKPVLKDMEVSAGTLALVCVPEIKKCRSEVIRQMPLAVTAFPSCYLHKGALFLRAVFFLSSGMPKDVTCCVTPSFTADDWVGVRQILEGGNRECKHNFPSTSGSHALCTKSLPSQNRLRFMPTQA